MSDAVDKLAEDFAEYMAAGVWDVPAIETRDEFKQAIGSCALTLFAALVAAEEALTKTISAYETCVSMGVGGPFSRHFPDAAKADYAALAQLRALTGKE